MLETHRWNLSMSTAVTAVTVLAGCGPFVIPEDPSDSNTSSATDSDVTVTAGGECTDSNECGPGYACFEGNCIPYSDSYDCQSGGCCYEPCCYDYGYGCYDTDTYTYPDTGTDTTGLDCYSHESCGFLQMCNEFGNCQEAVELLPCPEALEVVPLALPTTSTDAFVSLAFVDATGDPWQDLVVGRSGSAELLLGPGDVPPIALPVPLGSAVIDAAAGDFDGDGNAELVLSTDTGALVVLTSDGAGGYIETTTLQARGPVLDLATLQWNGDGMLDLVGRVDGGQARVYWGDGAGGFMNDYALVTTSPVGSLALTELLADGYGDVVLQDQDGVKRYEGSNAGNLTHDGLLPAGWPGERRLLSGVIDSEAPDEIVGYTLQPDWTPIELWPNAIDSPQYYGFDGPWLAADMGDFNADGSTDLVLAGAALLGYARSSTDKGQASFSCVSTVDHQLPLGAMAVGDFDGDIQADVAIGSLGGVTVLLTQ